MIICILDYKIGCSDYSSRTKIKTIESETKDVLKPICNDDCVILGRSEAKNQSNPLVLTAMLQSFGTRLRAADLPHLMG